MFTIDCGTKIGTSLHHLEQFCDLNYSNTTTGLQFFMVQLYLNSSNLPQMVLWGLFKISDKSWSQILSSLASGLSAGQATTQAFWLQNGLASTGGTALGSASGQDAGSHFSWSVSLAISVLRSDFSVNLTDSPDSDMSDESSCNNHHREAGIIVPQSEWGESINFIEKSNLNMNPQYLLYCRFPLHSSLLSLISIQSLGYHSYIT